MLLEWTSKSKCTFLGTIFIDQFSRRLFCRLSIDPSSRDSIWSHAIYQCRHPKHCWSSSSLVRWRSLASPTEHPIATCESHVCHKRSYKQRKVAQYMPRQARCCDSRRPRFWALYSKGGRTWPLCILCAHWPVHYIQNCVHTQLIAYSVHCAWWWPASLIVGN